MIFLRIWKVPVEKVLKQSSPLDITFPENARYTTMLASSEKPLPAAVTRRRLQPPQKASVMLEMTFSRAVSHAVACRVGMWSYYDL